MSCTVDHLRVDHRVTVLRAFTDAAGIPVQAGEHGILRELAFDQIRLELRMQIEREPGEREAGMVALAFPLQARTGPRNGHMREYFEMGDYVPVPGSEPMRREPPAKTMIVPPTTTGAEQDTGPAWWREARNTEGPDRLEDVEQAMRRATDHIGVAGSIAEMYAQRMRAFQHAGNEPRAAAAFRLAVDWMGTYAGWATSGGEGAALSDERDRFHAALVHEFGYDPTETITPPERVD